MPDAPEATTAALASSEQVEAKEASDGEDDIEKVWDVSDLHRSSKRYASGLERVKSLCKPFSLPVLITVVEAQGQIEDTIRAFADYPRLEASVKNKNADSAVAQKIWEQKTAVYKKELAKLRQQVIDNSAFLPKLEDFTFTASDLECMPASSQSRIQELKEQLLVATKRLEKSASLAANAKLVTFDLQIKLQDFEK